MTLWGYDLPAPVDAILCHSDSLNHLLAEDELIRTFAAVHRNLKPGGRAAVIGDVEGRRFPFDGSWLDWRPDPGWRADSWRPAPRPAGFLWIARRPRSTKYG